MTSALNMSQMRSHAIVESLNKGCVSLSASMVTMSLCLTCEKYVCVRERADNDEADS